MEPIRQYIVMNDEYKNSGYPNWGMLGELIKETKPKIVVEIGTYYGGWTKFLSENTSSDTRIFTFQTPERRRLNHLADTTQGENNILPDYVVEALTQDYPETWGNFTAQNWKDLAKQSLDKKYHGMYDFNLLADAISNDKKITCILATSPLPYPWPVKYDLCTINLSYHLDDNLKQIDYWIKYAKKNGILCISSYGSIDKIQEIYGKDHKVKRWSNGYLWIYGKSKI